MKIKLNGEQLELAVEGESEECETCGEEMARTGVLVATTAGAAVRCGECGATYAVLNGDLRKVLS